MVGATVLAATAGATVGGARPGSAELAATIALTDGAAATATAVRVGTAGQIMFPLSPVPRCDVLDSFGDVRSGGRSHEGVDILATLGQEVYAVADGRLITRWVAEGPQASLSGNAWRLAGDDGDLYFYAHLSGFAAGLELGSRVTKGQLIGYVGDTGNPGAGNYHLHFEYQPDGGRPVDALPLLTIPLGCRVY